MISHRAIRRREQALSLLHDGAKYALVADPDDPSHRGEVVLTLAIRTDRGIVTADLLLALEKYDPALLLTVVAHHGGTCH